MTNKRRCLPLRTASCFTAASVKSGGELHEQDAFPEIGAQCESADRTQPILQFSTSAVNREYSVGPLPLGGLPRASSSTGHALGLPSGTLRSS